MYILYEAAWTTEASLNAVDNSKIQCRYLNYNSDFSVIYLAAYLQYRLRCLFYCNYIHSFSILSDDRSKASSKTIPPHSAIDLELPPSNESILSCP